MTGGIIAAIIIGVIVFFLSVPLDLHLRFEAGEKWQFIFRLRWLFGLVKTGTGKRKKKQAPQKKAKKRGRRDWSWLSLLRTRGLPGKFLRLLKDILKQIKIRDLNVDLEISLGDPADTAVFIGGLWLPTFLLSNQTQHHLRIAPSFYDDPIVRGQARLSIRIIPIRLVPAVLRFGLSRAGFRVIKTVVFRRWNREKP